MRKRLDSGENNVFVKRLHGVSEVVLCDMSVCAIMILTHWVTRKVCQTSDCYYLSDYE
jgi:hypothetical protein